MSAPQALRLAIEACRPTRTSATRLRPLLQSRPFTYSQPLRKRGGDITEGFPTPRSDPQLEDDTAPNALENPAETPFNPTSATDVSVQPEISPDSKLAADMAEAGQPFTPEKPSPALKTSSPAPSSAAPSSTATQPLTEPEQEPEKPHMYPPNVLATYLAPMRHQRTHGIPIASLQLRSYSVRNLEFFADFCIRAAFYLKLPASGPVPLPRQTERWTTLRSNFIFKKSQENFERITYKRLITVYDSDSTAAEAWLAFVRKWQFYGVGMKANVWQFEAVDVAKNMDEQYNKEISGQLNEKLSLYGWNKYDGQQTNVPDELNWQEKSRTGPGSPMSQVTAFDPRKLEYDRALAQGGRPVKEARS